MITHYFKIAFRSLWKYKTQNIISIIGLAVGLLCFSICMYCSRFVEDTDRCFSNYKRIAELSLYNNNQGYFSGSPAPLAEELRTWATGEIEAVTCVTYPRTYPYNVTLSQDKILPYELSTFETDTFYNEVFTPQIVAGSWETASRTPNAVIMSQSTATRIFDKAEEAIGKQLTLTRRLGTSPESTPRTGGIAYTIQAVMEDIPLNNSFAFMERLDMLTLNDSEGLLQSPKRYEITGANNYVLLSPHITMKGLEKQFSKRNYTYTLYSEKYTVTVHRTDNTPQMKSIIILEWITGIVGLLILLVGLMNFFHFLIGSFFNRTKEYSIMKMTGCNWRQLFSLLFVQSLLVIGCSSFLVLWGIELIGSHLNFSIAEITMNFDTRLLLIHALQYIGLLILLCAIICLFVAIRIHKISVQTGINGGNKRRGKQWGRNLMLGIQFFICWIFVTLSASLYLQSRKTMNTLFSTLSVQEKSEIFSVPLNYTFMKNAEKLAMVERFRQHAGVKDILLSDVSYMDGFSGNQLMTEKGNDNSWIEIMLMAVPSNFFSFMNIPIEQGREIHTKQDIVVDRTYQETQKKNVIGMNLYDQQNDYTVCGICTPFETNVYNHSNGYAFIPYETSGYIGHCYIKCYPGQVGEVKKWVEKIRREMLPESVSCEVRTLMDDIYEMQALEYNLKDIILFFAIVSIIITLLGVYSSITLDTERRQKEVAIRKVNGAGIPQIILLFSRLYIVLLAGSAVIAFPLIYATLMLWKQMYTVFFNCGFLFWCCIFLVVTFITAVTIFFRILRIARSNPAEVIKNE